MVALLSALLLVGPAAGSADAIGKAKYEKQARKATNAERQDEGLGKLRKNKCVQRFAVKQARKMAKKQKLYHQDLDPVLEKCDLRTVGENVAYGYSDGKAVVKAWMGSPGHRANILHEDFRLLGMAARKSDDGRWYAAQVFGRK